MDKLLPCSQLSSYLSFFHDQHLHCCLPGTGPTPSAQAQKRRVVESERKHRYCGAVGLLPHPEKTSKKFCSRCLDFFGQAKQEKELECCHVVHDKSTMHLCSKLHVFFFADCPSNHGDKRFRQIIIEKFMLDGVLSICAPAGLQPPPSTPPHLEPTPVTLTDNSLSFPLPNSNFEEKGSPLKPPSDLLCLSPLLLNEHPDQQAIINLPLLSESSWLQQPVPEDAMNRMCGPSAPNSDCPDIPSSTHWQH